ncbi:MAG: Dabb family protein [Bacteroidota bacterium]
MFVHHVLFWLKEGSDKAGMRKGLESLRGIESIEAIYIGEPVASERPVVDDSFDFSLMVVLKDLAGHDAYQVDPLHQQFFKDCSSMWAKVVVYDAS